MSLLKLSSKGGKNELEIEKQKEEVTLKITGKVV